MKNNRVQRENKSVSFALTKHLELAVVVGLFLHLCRILRGFSPLYAISTDLNIAPAVTFFLNTIEHYFRDYRLIVAFGSISVDLAVVGFPLCLIFRCVSFEDNGDAGCIAEKLLLSCHYH